MDTKSIDAGLLARLALVGATVRHRELTEELGLLEAAYPQLAGGRRRAARTRPVGALAQGQELADRMPAEAMPTRRRHRMSVAKRKAVSERMKRFWAERRKAKAAKPAAKGARG